MADLVLRSETGRALRPLVEGALANEPRIIDAGIARTAARIEAFEREYGLDTTTFLERYERGCMAETLDLDEWIGEYRLLARLREKAETLQGVRILD